MERTLSIVKPDGVKKKVIGEVVARYEAAGLRVAAMRMITMTAEQARGFYAVHRDKPFFPSLVEFMISGPVVVMVVEGEGAIPKVREIMGATDPAKAAPGTIRQQHGGDIQHNIVHGSDGPDTSAFEVSYFFPGLEIF